MLLCRVETQGVKGRQPSAGPHSTSSRPALFKQGKHCIHAHVQARACTRNMPSGQCLARQMGLEVPVSLFSCLREVLCQTPLRVLKACYDTWWLGSVKCIWPRICFFPKRLLWVLVPLQVGGVPGRYFNVLLLTFKALRSLHASLLSYQHARFPVHSGPSPLHPFCPFNLRGTKVFYPLWSSLDRPLES